jgi:hypothetical protein
LRRSQAALAGQQEGVDRVFAPLRREPHHLRHLSGPVGEARELTPNEPTERHDPYRDAERAMQLDEGYSLLLGRCEIDREGEHDDRGDEEQGQPVQEPNNRVETRSLGSPSVRSIGIPHSHAPTGRQEGDQIRRAFIPTPSRPCRILVSGWRGYEKARRVAGRVPALACVGSCAADAAAVPPV